MIVKRNGKKNQTVCAIVKTKVDCNSRCVNLNCLYPLTHHNSGFGKIVSSIAVLCCSPYSGWMDAVCILKISFEREPVLEIKLMKSCIVVGLQVLAIGAHDSR